MGRTSDAREKLLNAALDLIWTSSYGGVSVDDICERAGVNKGSFYHFFPSKADLAVAAYEAHWQCARPDLDRIFSPEVHPVDRLQLCCARLHEAQRQKFQEYGFVVGCPYANAGSELATQDPKIRAKAQEMRDRWLQYLAQTIRDGVELGVMAVEDPDAAAQQVYSSFLGTLLQAKILNDPTILGQLEPAVRRLLLYREPLAAVA
jgi:TetR/AcrR family transcriptional repressor of nem operon